MSDFSLVPVDHQPVFDDFSLVPVEHDQFGADGTGQQPQFQFAQAQPAQPQTEPAPTPTQLPQPQPQSSPQQPATGVGQPNIGAPAAGGSNPAGSPDSNLNAGNAGNSPNPPSGQDRAEPPPFGGYANPTLKESLVNTVNMDEQEDAIKADPKAGRVIDGQGPYKCVTTKLPIAEYPTDGGAGWIFTTNSPFYAKEGERTARIDASPERPVTVTIHEDGKFTISRP